jgi:fatty acid desaturase
LAAVYALAVLVHGSAVVGAVLGGPWMLVWFLPAMLGSLVAIWCVRHGVRLGTSPVTDAADKEEQQR